MTVSKTRLAAKDPNLAQRIDLLLKKGELLGVRTGKQRIELVCEQYDKVAPDVALALIDLDSIQMEVEDARLRSRAIYLAHVFRNLFSLAPLIATWTALFFAVWGYQTDLTLHPKDIQSPFLQQWQQGFRGSTWFTFTTAAGIDIGLLLGYLACVIIVQVLESQAQKVAVAYVDELNGAVDALIIIISAESYATIRGPEDIDKVARAVTNVITHAMEQTAKLTEAARQSVDASQTQVKDLFTQQIQPLFQQFDANTQQFNQTLATFDADLHALHTSIDQLTTNASTMASHAQNYVTIGQDMNTHLDKLQTTEQSLVGQLDGLSSHMTGVANNVETATAGLEHASTTVADATTHLDHGLDLTVTKITDSVDRATVFQQELNNFLTQLQQLNGITSTLTAASQGLTGQVQTMGSEVTALHTTQQQIAQQLTTVVGHVASAASNMTTSTARMDNVATSLDTVAQSMTSGLQQTVDHMTNNIDRATRALGQVENSLTRLLGAMDQTTQNLASISSTTGNTGNRGGGGFIDWLWQRRTRR